MPIQELDRPTVEGAYAKLRGEGGRGGKPLADSTVHPHPHETLRRALGGVVEDQVIRTNPAAGAHTAPSHAEQHEVWRDVDLEAATVTVVRAKTVRGRQPTDVDPGTVVVVLREQRTQQRRDRVAAGPAWREHSAVLAHEDGTPIHSDSVSRAFTRAVERCHGGLHRAGPRARPAAAARTVPRRVRSLVAGAN